MTSSHPSIDFASIASAELLNVDCMEYMATMPDKSFDLAIVDPPYGIGNNWSKSRKDTFYRQGDLHSYQNDKRPEAEYFAQLLRVSRNQIIWGGNYFTDFISPTNSWIIWDKFRNADITFMSEAEMAWTSFKKVTRIAKFKWDGARKCEAAVKIHPHQKPVKLYEWLLTNYAKPGQKILDTHLGSGSSAIACNNLGFELVGCELDPDYYDSACKRVAEYSAQKRLFA